METNSTFGFDTAVSFATQAIDRLHSTAEAYRRVMVVEVMGRTAGRIALYAGVAGGGEVTLIPEIPYDLERVADRVAERAQLGARCSIVVVAEGASPAGGETPRQRRADVETRRPRRPGRGAIGGPHRPRGAVGETGTPAARRGADELLPGAGHEVRRQGGGADSERRVWTDGDQPAPDIVAVPLADVVGRTKQVQTDLDLVRTARALGISLGDEKPTRNEPT